MRKKKKAVRKKAAKKKRITKTTRKPHWLTQTEICKYLEISRQAFREWGVQPVAAGRYTYYQLQDVIANRLAKQAARIEATRKPTADDELEQSERQLTLRLTRARAEGQEIKNAQLRKELAPVAVIEWVLGKAGGQISAILDALPALLKKRNPKLTASNIESIRREIAKAQNAASQMTVDLDEYYERNDTSDR